MKISLNKIIVGAVSALATFPIVAFAADGEGSSTLESLITLGYYISSIGFLVASITMFFAVKRFGKSTLGSIFSYIFIGTGIFFVITIFQKLGGEFFGIGSASMDIWWHLMFYMAFIFYFHGLKLLVGLGNVETSPNQGVKIGAEKTWAVVAVLVFAVLFIIPKSADSIVVAYDSSVFGVFGLHHFIAFVFAFAVGSYLLSAKKKLGMIGRAIANPMIVAIWAFGLQHVWELLFESWKVVDVTSATGEGIEKIFLVISAIGLSYAAWCLISFSKKAM
ncbi:MAG: hypothetical protein ABI430_01230 [Candidatus Taylorbacteria bacterium]